MVRILGHYWTVHNFGTGWNRDHLKPYQGHIWDNASEESNRKRSRRFVEPLVYVNIVLTLGELLWALVGTVWTIRGFITGCLEPGKLTFTDAPLIAVFVVIILTWIGRWT